MSKTTATNTWKDGLNKDLNPMLTPNTVLTDNLNGTFITYNGNEFSLQNDMGNVFTTRLSEGFYPIGMTEYGGIAYIVSIKDSYARYIKAERDGKFTLSATITALTNRVHNIDPDVPFSKEDAQIILTSKDGLLSSNSHFEEVVLQALKQLKELDVPMILNYYAKDVPSTMFEVGSVPSLPTSDLNINTISNDSLELDFEYKYRPFYNLIRNNELVPFSTTALFGYDLQHPASIEVQPSYDGSVNLIITDDKNVPRLINSGFAVLKNGKGKFVQRNQDTKTNYYNEETADQFTKLINSTVKLPIIDLEGVNTGGQLKCGNYTFYFKLGDEDGNKTDIIAESGIVSIFKGTISNPSTISGGIYNELSDKTAVLKLTGIDTAYSRIYVSYTREYCDLNGYRLTEAFDIIEPFKVSSDTQSITISGLEETSAISIEDLNIYYFNVNSNKTVAQQQNMLFLGNVDISEPNSKELQNLSYSIVVGTKWGNDVGGVDPFSYSGSGYYDPKNIYYNLGYWPNELYRFGIVYVKSDGSSTQVYNLKGCLFDDVEEQNTDSGHKQTYESDDSIFINGTERGDNIVGVFKTPDVDLINDSRTLCFHFEIPEKTKETLINLGVVGYFIVRQKRIPLTLCQGFGVGINKEAFIPTIKYGDKYYSESFITQDERLLKYDPITTDSKGTEYKNENNIKFYISVSLETYEVKTRNGLFIPVTRQETAWVARIIGPKKDEEGHIISADNIYDFCLSAYSREHAINQAKTKCYNNNWTLYDEEEHDFGYNTSLLESENAIDEREVLLSGECLQSNSAGLISVETNVNPTIQSMFNGTQFSIIPKYSATLIRGNRMFTVNKYTTPSDNSETQGKLIFLPENSPLKYVDRFGFSNMAGDGINVDQFGYVANRADGATDGTKTQVIRGLFTPFIGAITDDYANVINHLCDIRVLHDETYKNDIVTRANDTSAYYAVSNKSVISSDIDVYRGDCYKNTVTVRIHRNFVDSTAPLADKIVDEASWKNNYKGYSNVGKETGKTDWSQINLTDLNTVSLGHWLTFKCLANTNLGLRSEDTSNASEMALLGNPRSFYPLSAASTVTTTKVPDSSLLNDGYGATVGRKRYTLKQSTPYDKNEFSTRVVFSNVSVTDSFANGYRVFQGLSYRDYTKQYGAITKLLPYGNNLFCVFEHGIAIIPVNEKALMQTTTEQTIYIYGHGVLPDQLSIISQDFGSTWIDSVIRTPVGVYGIDTSAKKIWRYSDSKGLETLSDMKVQRFLNDFIDLGLIQQEHLGKVNVKTHFNNYKGDVLFTFYNNDNTWNLCYNERQGLWVSRYDWTPLFSVNVDNAFYSMPLVKYSDNNDITIWKHGRTGLDELKFKPALWYGKQHPFEFEFVVNDPIGIHKIFENLVITSNNVQPEEIEFQIIGDSYLFNRARIYHDAKNIYGNDGVDTPYEIDRVGFTKDNFDVSNFKPIFYNARVSYDPVLDEYNLIMTQKCKNKETYGVRLGNIQYKEDGWYTNIEPLRYNVKLNQQSASSYSVNDPFASAKIRDKWVKIRIKYTGDKLAIISGVTTFENISYA